MVTAYYDRMFCKGCNTPLPPDEVKAGIIYCRRCRHSNGDTYEQTIIPGCGICRAPLDVDSWIMGAEVCSACRQDIAEETQCNS